MSENKEYYSGNSNIFETLVDCSIDSLFLLGRLSWKFFKWSMDGWIDWSKYENKTDLNYFYQTTGTKNRLNEYPTVLKNNDNEFIVNVPTGLNLDDFEKSKKSLETYLNKNIEMTLNNNNLVVREIVVNELPSILPYEFQKNINGLNIPFAISGNGTEYIDFKEEPHVLITGSTGSGKSITLKSIITSLISLYPNEIELVLIDFKVVELAIFKRLKQVKSYVTDVQEATEIIADELEECKNRYKLFEELEVTNIYDYNKKVSKDKRLKYRFIVIEEFIMLTEDKKKIAMSMLKRLASISRASGQFLILVAQRFDNTVIDLVLRSNVGNRLCHKVQDEANSKLILDEVGAELLNNKGRMYYKSNGKKIECQGYYITDDKIRSIIKPYIRLKEEPQQIQEDIKHIQENKIRDLKFLDNI